MVDDAYKKINKAMFESLKVIAKESPAVMATQGQGDPEDKEALNIFSFWPSEIQSLVEWSIKADPLQGIGILYAVDRKLHEIEDQRKQIDWRFGEW